MLLISTGQEIHLLNEAEVETLTQGHKTILQPEFADYLPLFNDE